MLLFGLVLVRCLHVSPWWDGHSTWCQWTGSNSVSKGRDELTGVQRLHGRKYPPEVGGASAMLFRSSVLFSDVKDKVQL